VPSPTGIVIGPGSVVTMNGHIQLFQAPTKVKIATATRIERDSGSAPTASTSR
jgi:hypothetical protein